MKKELLIGTLLTLSGSSAMALINLGEGQIDLNMTGSVFYDSRVTAQDAAPEDTIMSLTTSLTYTRKSKAFDLLATAGVRIDEYLDNSQYSDENFFFDLAINPEAELRTSRLQFSGNLILNTQTTSNQDVGEIITTNEYGATGELVYDPNRKFTVIGDISTRTIDPDSDSYDRTRENAAGARIAVPLNSDMAAFGGLRFTQHEFDGDNGVDSDSMAYFIGADGTLFSRFNGSASVGIQKRSLDSGNDSTTPYISVALGYEMSERTKAEITASNAFGTTINSYNTEVMRLGLNVSHAFNRRWTGSWNVGYSDTTYESGILPDRSDQEVLTGVQVSRSIGDWARASLSIQYSDRSSDIAFFEYDRLRAGISISGNW